MLYRDGTGGESQARSLLVSGSAQFSELMKDSHNQAKYGPLVIKMLEEYIDVWNDSSPQKIYDYAAHGIDDALSKWEGRGPDKIHCKKGCSACCHMNVVMTGFEHQAIKKYVNDKGISVDLSLVQSQLPAVGDDLKRWMMPEEQSRCIFLSDSGKCRIYPVRPFACRTCFVSTRGPICETQKVNHSVASQ